jgi:anti-anti-sigma factor
MGSGNVFYAKHDGVLVLKFVGEIRYTMGDSYRISASLDQFLERLFEERDFQNIMIDLTETESIDSTNLGLLAKIAQYSEDQLGRKCSIISSNEDINAIIESVGFDQVFLILDESDQPEVELENVPEADAADRELAHMLLDAHRALTSLNDKNKEMFKNVVQLLEKRVQDYNGDEKK